MLRFFLMLLFLPITAVSQEIAFTFDDAPTGDGPLFTGLERSERILETLREHKVEEVAFFVLTRHINRDGEQRLKDYTRAGHLLANHSHNHLWIHQVGSSRYIRDVAFADSILKSYSGYQPWFRYPYLDEGRTIPARDSIRHALVTLGLRNGYVTVDNYDWYLNSLIKQAIDEDRKINWSTLREVYVEHIYESILFYDAIGREHLGRSPAHVLLLHENDLAALFLGDLISQLKRHGWKIISPRVAYQDPIATQIPDVLFNGQGRIAAIARANGIPARELVQESEDEEFLENLLRTRKVFE